MGKQKLTTKDTKDTKKSVHFLMHQSDEMILIWCIRTPWRVQDAPLFCLAS